MIHPSGVWVEDQTERHPDEIGYPDVHRRSPGRGELDTTLTV
ncbi:hypothetical protein [Streptomyces phage phiScoe54]|nr:hypothetical protein [Streptomyces phage phiScoe54]